MPSANLSWLSKAICATAIWGAIGSCSSRYENHRQPPPATAQPPSPPNPGDAAGTQDGTAFFACSDLPGVALTTGAGFLEQAGGIRLYGEDQNQRYAANPSQTWVLQGAAGVGITAAAFPAAPAGTLTAFFAETLALNVAPQQVTLYTSVPGSQQAYGSKTFAWPEAETYLSSYFMPDQEFGILLTASQNLLLLDFKASLTYTIPLWPDRTIFGLLFDREGSNLLFLTANAAIATHLDREAATISWQRELPCHWQEPGLITTNLGVHGSYRVKDQKIIIQDLLITNNPDTTVGYLSPLAPADTPEAPTPSTPDQSVAFATINQHCQACHQDNQSTGFTYHDAADFRAQKDQILAVIAAASMPPGRPLDATEAAAFTRWFVQEPAELIAP